MLSKINRIKDKKKFATILKFGAKYFCPFFLCLIEQPPKNKSAIQPTQFAQSETSPKPYIEFGFITSKKVGNAVERNHVRRVLSEIIMKEIPLIKPNTRVLIIGHNRATTQTFEDLQKEVRKVFSTAKLYK